MKKVLCIFFLFCFTNSYPQMNTAFTEPPEWSKHAIWYQIFVERFYNGDTHNDPKPANIETPLRHVFAPKDWAITPWTQDWYKPDAWMQNTGKDFNTAQQFRRYGGDLQGIIDKLDYLQQLGVNAIFLNPINDAPSLHKYDARYYHHVDINFGPDPEGDEKIIDGENPSDAATWQWTLADKLFLQLVADVHKRGMKIILDYSWNHTGTSFWAWQDVVKNQEKSPYKDWYAVKTFDNKTTPQNEFTYDGWLGIQDLPEIKKVNITTERVSGHAYEGDINEGAKQHIFSVVKRWLSPNGDTAKGIDGFRLDVADQIGLGFWRDFRKQVRAIKPDAYLVGEIWWEEFPDRLMNPAPFTNGDVFDAVMFYQVYMPARYFFAKTNFEINAEQFKDSLEFQWNRLRKNNCYAMMNVSSTHDAPRLLTDFYNPNKYKLNASPHDDANYKTGIPDLETYKRVQLYLVHLFTSVGAPQIWNGEEMGMTGAFDPDCRKPLWWQEYSFEKETRTNYQPGEKQYDAVGFNKAQFEFYRKLIAIRKNNPVLNDGEIEFITAHDKMLAYKRFDALNEIIVLFNVEGESRTFTLPASTTYKNLLTGKKVKGDSITLKSLTAAVLRKEN